MEYAVVIVKNLQEIYVEPEVILFENYDDARNYISTEWKKALNGELVENPDGLLRSDCYDNDGHSAQIKWQDGDFIEYYISEIRYEKMYNNRLKELRIEKKLSQIQIQMKTGIDQSDYSKMENGKRYPTVDQAIILAELFETSIDYIFGVTDERKPYPRR